MTNEAAERLRADLAIMGQGPHWCDLLDTALANEYERGKLATVKAIDAGVRGDERKATVERIRAALDDLPAVGWTPPPGEGPAPEHAIVRLSNVRAILDAEAAR